MTVRCANCGAEQVAPDDRSCAACGWLVFEPTAGPTILVAHENREVSRHIGEVLQRAGFSVASVASGARALGELSERAAVVLDVGLGSDMMAFQVIEAIRAHPEDFDIPVVLVASVYNKTAYKRRPSDLYGADDYVEQHHIGDMLPEKLCRLLSIDATGVADLFSDGENSAFNARLRDANDSADASIAAAAHTIISDIALYHQAEFERVASGEDARNLAGALAEGSKMLAKMMGLEPSAAFEPVKDAFDAFVADLRKDGR